MKLYLREEYFGGVLYDPATASYFNLGPEHVGELTEAARQQTARRHGSWLTGILREEQSIDLVMIRNPVARPGVLSAPLKAFFNLTKRCNLYCAHCYNSSGEPDSPELGFADIVAALEALHRHGVFKLTLAGGEPMFHRHFDDILGRLRATDLAVSIVTNGICITDDRAQLLGATASLRSVTVSLDGASPDTNDLVRGRGAFQRAVAGVRSLRRHYDRELALRITLMRSNLGETDRFAELADHLGASEIKVNSINPYGRAIGRDDLLIGNAEYVAARDRLAAAARRHGLPIEVPAHKYQRDANDQVGLCRAGEETCEIDGDGRVFPCSFSFGRFCAGNLAALPFTEILRTLQQHSIDDPWCLGCKGRGGKAEKVYGRVPKLVERVTAAGS
ncbi:radical SAM protein [Bradyrhizobium sp. HKCCYLRH1030]|uniref:radical SAM protein n=1 Tax=Bradyrhizobium sp. HKCCYLRH1030 TaxID=3420744 RepID=UPI003EB8ABB8